LITDTENEKKKQYKKLSILIPVYNEKDNISKIINKIQKTKIPLKMEIIIIDDCSQDGTREAIKKKIIPKYKNIKYYEHETNIGKGGAIRTALKHHTGDIVIIQDADLEYYPSDYIDLIKPIIKGKAKVVFGSRYLYKKLHGNVKSAGFLFKVGGFFITHIFNLIYGTKLTDESTCYKVFDSEVIRKIKLNCKRFEFCPEISAKLIRLGYKIIEVPVKYSARTIKQGKKIRIKDAFEAVYVMIKYRFANKKSFIKQDKSNIDKIFPEYNSNNPLVRKVFKDRLSYAIKLSNLSSNQKILDVGTGNGILLKMLNSKYNNKFVGLDINKDIRKLKLPNTSFIICDARRLSFKSNSFDMIYCLDVLEHIKELDLVIRDIKRVLKYKGQLVVSVPQENILYKCARFLLKGTLSKEKGPSTSPHLWNAKQIINQLNKNFNLRRKKVLYKPLSLFQILSYEI